MDIFDALEERVERLVQAHRALQGRVAELEAENARLRAEGSAEQSAAARVDELEREREALRGRLERLLEQLSALEISA